MVSSRLALANEEPVVAVDASDFRFQRLLEAVPDAVVCVGGDGRIAVVNAQTERLFGYGRDELIGESIKLLVPDSAPAVRPSRWGRDPVEGPAAQLTGRRKDGTRFPAEITVSATDVSSSLSVIAAIRDVTDRRRAEAKFRGLLEATEDAVVAVASDGRIALVNVQSERLFGYTRDELLGESVEILVPDALGAVHSRSRASYWEAPTPRLMADRSELAGRRKDGSVFPATIGLSPIETEDGVLVCAIIRDISEQRRAADEQARLAAIVESSHDAIVSMTLDGIITSWNRGAERLYGYTSEEIVGHSVGQLVPPARRHHERRVAKQIARGGKVERYETERVRKDGTLIPVARSVSPIVDPSGQIIGVASSSRDLGERERAAARLRALLEAAPDATIGVREDGRIALLNAQAERLFGYDRSELLGQNVDVLVPAASRGIHSRLRAGYSAAPSARPMGTGDALCGLRKDGTEFPAEISLSSIQTDDGMLISASIRDISDRIEAQVERERLKAQAERERLENQLHQSQRLESLGQLAGGVAHDFNNLLAVVVNYASFLSEEISSLTAGETDERWLGVHRDIAEIEGATERARRLTHQLLTFGRREIVQPRVLNVGDVVRDVEQLLRRTIGEHVELATSVADDLWSVKADPGQLEQVLVNLAVNARDAMRDGGILTIEVHNVVADHAYTELRPGVVPGLYVRLRVSDTGTGMPDDVVRHAFEPFYTTKPRGEGSGLGLATVYGIVQQAGGRADIYSEPGIGTAFSALLPATDEAGAAPRAVPAGAAGATRCGGETILVVEDEDAIREVTRRILTRNGYKVLLASRGGEAIAIAEQPEQPIDLLLSDVVMPQMLGREIAERIRAIRPGVRVVFMSGYAQPILASERRLDPGMHLIEKPFTQSALLSRIREVLTGQPER